MLNKTQRVILVMLAKCWNVLVIWRVNLNNKSLRFAHLFVSIALYAIYWYLFVSIGIHWHLIILSTTRYSKWIYGYIEHLDVLWTALIKLQQLVRPPLSKSVSFIFRKSNPSTFREVLKDVRTRGIYSIIIDTRPESLPNLLTAVSVPTFYLIYQIYRLTPPVTPVSRHCTP